MQITKAKIKEIYQPVLPDSHKGTQGHVLLIGGSHGKIGSMVLASRAALRSGCGLMTAFVPQCGYEILQCAFPEAMVLVDNDEKQLSRIQFEINPDAIAIGMGMGQGEKTQKAFRQFLRKNNKPLLIDADGLNILSQHKDWMKLLSENTILTPHLKELERLIGKWDSEEQKLEKTQNLARNHNLIIVMKGAPTWILNGENIFENTTGNQALSTAGSGDCLSGIIASLLAQNYKSQDAAILGVYLHGLTADIAVAETGYESFIASDCIANLGKAFLSLK